MPKTNPNSNHLEHDQILCYLALGSRKPQNEKEERWLKSINDAKIMGYSVEIPAN
jgi:hypothetical protein